VSQENVELVREALQASGSLDAERYLSLCSADVELVSPITTLEGLTGPEGIRRSFKELERASSSFSIEVEELRALDADTVLAFACIRGSSAQGVPTKQPITNVYTLTNGKICRVRIYLDRDEALEAVGMQE
jgi:ketosteroid isomerase-like protein